MTPETPSTTRAETIVREGERTLSLMKPTDTSAVSRSIEGPFTIFARMERRADRLDCSPRLHRARTHHYAEFLNDLNEKCPNRALKLVQLVVFQGLLSPEPWQTRHWFERWGEGWRPAPNIDRHQTPGPLTALSPSVEPYESSSDPDQPASPPPKHCHRFG